jgi:hypothetical protein
MPRTRAPSRQLLANTTPELQTAEQHWKPSKTTYHQSPASIQGSPAAGTAAVCAGSAKAGGRVVAHAAALPAFAAAGVIWELKDQLHHDKDSRTAVSTLIAQPSVLNWHDMPVAAQ